MRALILIGLLIPQLVFSQINKDSIHFSGYTEIYFAQDQHNWNDHQRPDFLYSHTSTNHFALNTAVIDFKYSSERVKTQLSLVEGTYANKVTSAEPIGFGALYVGNISYKLSGSRNFWLQAGIFPSHIGIETAIGFSNLSLSRSLAAENSPYYESGVALQYTSKNEKWYASALLLNGWQTMTLIASQTSPGLGMQLQYKPNNKFVLNYSNYIGDVRVADSTQARFYQDVYADIQVKEKLHIQAQVDYAVQSTLGKSYNKNWSTGFIGVAYAINEKLTAVGRGEWMSDPSSLVVLSNTNQMWGYSFNFNYKLDDHLMFRAEYRNLNSKVNAFSFQNLNEKHINGLNLSLAAQF